MPSPRALEASPNLQTPTPGPSRLFVAEVAYLPDSARPTFPRDIEGSILAANGTGVDGVRVRISSGGWNAVDVTRGAGSFRFSVEGGTFTIQPVTINSQAATVSVDGTARVSVVFRERDVSVAATPVPSPPPTLTPLPTLTPSPSPSVSPTPEQEATPRPTAAPLVGGPFLPPTPTAAASAPSPRAQPPGGGLDLEPWVQTFLGGFFLGGLLLAAGLGYTTLRR